MTVGTVSEIASRDGGAPMRRRGVAAKLRNAFIGVSLFPMLAAVVGIASFQIIEDAQDELLDRSLPATIGAERIAKQGLSVIAATPAVHAAMDDAELARETAQIQSANQDLKQIIPEMRGLGVAEELLGGIEADLDTVFANLGRQIELVSARNQLDGRLKFTAEQVLTNAKWLIATLQQQIIDASARLSAKTDGIRESLSQPNAVGRQTLDAFEELANVDINALERLTSMRFRAENLISHVDKLLLSVDSDSVASVRNELNIDLRSLARSALVIGDRSLRDEIGQSLQVFSDNAHEPANIFQLKLELIQINDRLRQLRKENVNRAAQLQTHVVLLLAQVGSLIRASTERARGVVMLGRISLATIAVVALVVAIWVVWKYVLKDVAERVRRLAGITRDLAQGNIEVSVDVTGDDELGEMADAVRVFKANATELRLSNAELEQFAYIASHDLKAPMRAISNLATWIEEDLKGVMNDETKQHMTLLHGRIDRMEALLEDLLQYSRVGREKIELRTVDLNQAIPQIFNLVAPSDRFQLRVASPLPEFATASAPLELIFRNLTGNAIKHHDAESGSVEIEVKDLGPVYEFLVRDDGPGIPAQYHEKIFNLFQTLKSRDEVEGSGMGLAIVKKIVESIGCTIVVESDPASARGSTFRFTWPKQWHNTNVAAKAA